uniref:Tyrosine--tRNA ligase n=1 Tax=Meloidogyne enterolobii TaxID=390850 RepID=A0A6V7UJ45_MELEN|nr:unnamed protein product [Meloidogyne enterolobii]
MLMLTRRYFSSKYFSTPLVRFIDDLQKRDLIVLTHPTFPFKEQDILSYASSLPNVLYAGFDATANSLHIGNLLILTSLIRSSQFGCTPLLLIGEGTAAVGDPSGQTGDRQQISRDELKENARFLTEQLHKIMENANTLSGSKPLPFKILNNIDWYKETTMLDFLMSSRRFRVGDMLRIGPVKNRMDNEQTLSFSEFTYQILQANDWLFLSQKYDCLFQLGGSDQLGNFKTGFENVRAETGKQSLGICVPLLTDGNGNKLGKSAKGIAGSGFWLSAEKSSPFAFYQYFRQLHDDISAQLLLQFSLKEVEEILQIIEEHNNKLGKWIAQTHLADEMTSLVHGHEGLELARRCSQLLFHGSLDDLEKLEPETVKGLFGEASTFNIPKNSVKTLGEVAEITKPGGAQLMTKGALKINGVRISDPDQKLDVEKFLLKNQFSLICWGKRKFSLIQWL